MFRDFIEQILQERGLPADIEPEVRKKMADDMEEKAVDLINMRLIEALPQDKLPELENIIDNQPEDQAAFQKFIEDNVPDKDRIVTLALVEFKGLYLGNKSGG